MKSTAAGPAQRGFLVQAPVRTVPVDAIQDQLGDADALISTDRDVRVTRISGQPFKLTWHEGKKTDAACP